MRRTRPGPLHESEWADELVGLAASRLAEELNIGGIIDSGVTIWSVNETPGKSLYFMDPDGHRLELHSSTLGARLDAMDLDPPEGYERLDRG